MHFDGWNTIEGRHLVLAYASVVLIQGAYFAWVARNWRKLDAPGKKSDEASRLTSSSEEYRR